MSAPYMPLYIADYLADTTHLTRSEHGAYLLLLMAMWRGGGKLPTDDVKLARLTKCNGEEWADMRDVIMDFFKRRGGTMTHKRLSAEYAKYENTLKRKSEGGKASAAKKAKQNNDNDGKILGENDQDIATNQNHNQNQKEDSIGTGATDWPANTEVIDTLISQSGLCLTNAETWHLRTAGVVALWRHNGFSFWDEVLPTIKALVDGGAKVKSWAYFTDAIAECRANRLKPIPIPEPRQTHERRNPDNRDQSAGRSTDYIREAIDLDQQRRGANLDRASGF